MAALQNQGIRVVERRLDLVFRPRWVSMILILKLTLGPLLVAAATLAARKWGPRVGGFVAGLPLSTGPIYLFLLIDQGAEFAESAATGVLLGLVGLASFGITYACTAQRIGWLGALFFATSAFFLTSLCVTQVQMKPLWAGFVGFVALLIAACVISPTGRVEVKRPVPWWDLVLRMCITVALTLTITGIAARLGPQFSGALGASPIIATVVVGFTHQQLGALAAITMLRSIVLSWFSLVGGFVLIGSLIKPWGIVPALVCGIAAILVTAGSVPWLDGRLSNPLATSPHGCG